MVLAIIAIDETGTRRSFSVATDQLAVQLDVVNQIVAMRHTLIQVQLIDEGQVVTLPIDAFDGTPVSGIFSQLETEWQSVLAQRPVPHVVMESGGQEELGRYVGHYHQPAIESDGATQGTYERITANYRVLISLYTDLRASAQRVYTQLLSCLRC